MTEQFNKLKNLLGEIYDLNAALAVLGWDQQTYMPSGGAEERGNAMATLVTHFAPEDHFRRISDAVWKIVRNNLKECLLIQMKPDWSPLPGGKSTASCAFRPIGWRLLQKQLPSGRKSGNRQKSHLISRFQPQLEKIIELRREYASFFQPYDHIYDPLLDEFEPGLKTADVQKVFRSSKKTGSINS